MNGLNFLMIMFSLLVLVLLSLFPHTCEGAKAVAGVLGNCYALRLKNLRQRRSKVRGVNLNGLATVDPELVAVLFNNDSSANATEEFLLANYQINLNNSALAFSALPELTLFQWTAAAGNLGLNATALLLSQWNHYFNELNFALISRANLNSVRINLGWWTIYNGTGLALPYGYSSGDLPFVDQAFKWANQYGIGILLDIQFLVGQAETDSSTMWNATNVALSIKALRALVNRYYAKPALLGFQVANSPIYGGSVQTNYYTSVYTIIRNKCPNCLVVIAASGTSLLSTFMTPPTYTNVWTEKPFTVGTTPAAFVTGRNNASNSTLNVVDEVSSWSTDIGDYSTANNLDRKGRPLLIGAWTGRGMVDLLQGSMASTGLMQQFLLQQRTALGGSKNAGWFYDTWTQSPSINGTESPSYLSALQQGMISVNDIAADTDGCPAPYLCYPSYPSNNYLKAVGQCGNCGTAALLTAAGVNKKDPTTWYQLQGCYQDNFTTPDLLFRFSVQGLTLELCNNLCTTFSYFAVQSDGITSSCSCGDFYGSYGPLPSSACNVTHCSGNSTETCGGPLANKVYKRKTAEVICQAIP